MNILAIDTSTEACSAALLRDDGVIFSEFEYAPRQHTRLLPRMMDAVISRSNISKQLISHIAFANGPGAFTGIRIAASTAQGIGLALNIPLIPISTLATLAQVCFDKSPFKNTLVALDARMGEVYWAWFERSPGNFASLQGEEQLSKVADVVIDIVPDCGVGHGWRVGVDQWLDKCINRESCNIDADLLPDARSMLKLAALAIQNNQMSSAENAGINYLRNKVAEKSRRE